MTISIGERIPNATLKTKSADGPADLPTGEIFEGKTVVLFGVPGAFTPTCSMNHLPGFLTHNRAFRDKGVDTIAVVSANDVFVMGAWKEAKDPEDKILFLSDGNCEFAKALGLDADLSVAGLGTRFKRFSMLVEDGVVKLLNVEDSPGSADLSTAEALLEAM